MITTPIYISRNLESVIPKSLVIKEKARIFTPLEKWNATLFYVERKKCLWIINVATKYSVIVPAVTKNELKNITELFVKNFIEQLAKEKLFYTSVELISIQEMIGTVAFYETDKDLSTIGTLNSLLQHLETWKWKFGSFDNWNFREVNRRVNNLPNKQLGWKSPKERMHMLLLETLKGKSLSK